MKISNQVASGNLVAAVLKRHEPRPRCLERGVGDAAAGELEACRRRRRHLRGHRPDADADAVAGELVSVRLGALDPGHGIRPEFRAFVAYAAEWEPIPEDGLERFPEAKPR
jgi:hypothetical protein